MRLASARFMRKLRLLTRIYDVPLVFDEVQTGWGMTGRLWAHELFDLPCPPDVVTWAKKAQNGVLFVSEELATFFQEEKKFNTTWEGDSVGMVRLLALLDKLDLEQVRRTGERARSGLEALAREYPRDREERPRRGRHARLRRPARRLARGAARPRVPARPGAPAGRRAHACASIRATTPSRPRSTRRCRFCAWRSRTSSAGASRRTPPRRRRSASARWPFRSTRSRSSISRRPSSRRYKLQILAVEQERYGARAVSRRRAARRPAAAAAVPARDARGDDGQPARDRHRPARPRLGTVRRLRARQRAREPRRGRRQRPIRTSARTTRSTCRRWPRCPPCRTPSSSRTICWTRCGSARSRPASSSCRRSSRIACGERPAVAGERDGARADRELPAQRHRFRLPAGGARVAPADPVEDVSADCADYRIENERPAPAAKRPVGVSDERRGIVSPLFGWLTIPRRSTLTQRGYAAPPDVGTCSSGRAIRLLAESYNPRNPRMASVSARPLRCSARSAVFSAAEQGRQASHRATEPVRVEDGGSLAGNESISSVVMGSVRGRVMCRQRTDACRGLQRPAAAQPMRPAPPSMQLQAAPGSPARAGDHQARSRQRDEPRSDPLFDRHAVPAAFVPHALSCPVARQVPCVVGVHVCSPPR